MSRYLFMAATLIGLGCSHVTRAGEERHERPDGGVESSHAETKPPAKPWADTAGNSAAPRTERAAAAPGRPELATSPEGLMTPEGPKLIQQALRRRGYLSGDESGKFDQATGDALQRFQVDHGLPSTGAPDRVTIGRLGLSADKVFRKPGSGSTEPPAAK